MNLYFMRHGQAAPISRGGITTDAQRTLTPKGRQDVADVIDSRLALLDNLQVIMTSPYLRARQTAEIVVERLERGGQTFTGEFLVCDELRPESNLAALRQLLDGMNASAILMTAHQPFIGNVLSALVDDFQLAGIGTAWLTALELEVVAPGLANLSWLQKPGH